MTHDPQPITDVFGFLMGDGFVMEVIAKRDVPARKSLALSAKEVIASAIQHHPREVWPGIEDDVAELERLLG